MCLDLEAFQVMLSGQKWKCSWPLIATIASVVAVFSVVHLFSFPVLPFKVADGVGAETGHVIRTTIGG